MKCPICRHELVVSDKVDLIDSYGQGNQIVRLRYMKQPEAIVFKKRRYGQLKPHFCLECGYVATFMKDDFLKLLHQEFQTKP